MRQAGQLTLIIVASALIQIANAASASSCYASGYQNCLDYYGQCTYYSYNCAKKCTTDTQCSTSCCQNNYCSYTYSSCYSTSYSTATTDSVIVIAIVIPVVVGTFFLICILCIIIQRCRRASMVTAGQAMAINNNNNAMVNNQFQMNDQMMKQNAMGGQTTDMLYQQNQFNQNMGMNNQLYQPMQPMYMQTGQPITGEMYPMNGMGAYPQQQMYMQPQQAGMYNPNQAMYAAQPAGVVQQPAGYAPNNTNNGLVSYI